MNRSVDPIPPRTQRSLETGTNQMVIRKGRLRWFGQVECKDNMIESNMNADGERPGNPEEDTMGWG